MQDIARLNGAKKMKSYFSKKLNCSNTTIKLMTKCLKSSKWKKLDENEYLTRNSYGKIKKISIVFYAQIIKLIIEEINKLDNDEGNKIKEKLESFIKHINSSSKTFEKCLSIQTISGLNTVIYDEHTANRINNISNSKEIAGKIHNELNGRIKEIK